MAQIVSKKIYARNWLALMALLIVTFGFSRLDLGAFNTPVAMLISFVKMVLIILFFMHMRYSRRVLWIFVCAGFVWLFIMLELTLSDYFTRGYSWSQ
jgi:cytochrome c oxidase subunit 4